MKYDVVQTALEKFVQDAWTLTELTLDNTAFNAELFNEYVECNVVFGDGRSRAVTKGCYRQTGLLILTVKVKPSTGAARKMVLATAAADLVKKAVVPPASSGDPYVNLDVPDLFNDNKERAGWVMAQVSCPFYYDFTST